MWENAAKHTDTPPAPPAAAEPGEYDTLLWAQIILCVLIAAGVFAARAADQGRARMSLTVGIMNTVHLNNVVARLKKVKDVLTVTRN